MSNVLASYVHNIQNGDDLSQEQSFDSLSHILDGTVPPQHIETFLLALSNKGESVSELIGFTKAMRSKMTRVFLSKPALDVCGTGGTGKQRFNVSTTMAFVLAVLGVPVAKHGNRGSKSANGSFDFLEALEINFMLSPDQSQSLFEKTDLCFLFAKQHHAAVRFAAPARQTIAETYGKRTVFNLLGPLCNPAEVPFQIIGTISIEHAEKIAEVLKQLPITRALVIVGGGGLDELSPFSPNHIIDVRPDQIISSDFDPSTLSLSCNEEAILGGDAVENAAQFKSLFSGKVQSHPVIDFIALNAGAGLFCYGKVATIEEGYHQALTAIELGKVWEKYEQYRDYSHQV